MASSPPQRRGILELLDHGNHLKTPIFQRGFAWERPQIIDFWTDITRALDGSPTPDDYFLGLLVLDDQQAIQDGQQRLATTLLLAAEMHLQIDAAKAEGPHNSQLAINASAQISAALRQEPSTPLVISPEDQAVLLSRAGISSDAPESSKRLAAARKELESELAADLASRPTPDAKLSRLNQLGTFLRSGAYVVVLSVPPKDAHNIFETLNTRGVRLSNGDLVKSHLISRATDTTLAVAKWNAITKALTGANGRYESDLESFLLHYFGSRFDRTTKADFFADYRSAVAQLDALAALDQLLESAKLYRALVDPASSQAFWTTIGNDTQEAVEVLNGLGLKQLRYLLLAVLRDLAGKNPTPTARKRQRNAVIKITAWSVRGLVQGQTGDSAAERTYVRAALAIRGGQLKSVAELKQHFLKEEMLVTDDKAFEIAFRAHPFDRKNSHTRAKVILAALEHHKAGSKAGMAPKGTLTVEHVLPISPAAGEWAAFEPEQRPSYTYRLGNLLLIDGPSGANDALGNKEWKEKKALISGWGAQTPLTTEALRRKEWTPSTIEARTNALATLATSAWSV
jgi:hypothetical protein